MQYVEHLEDFRTSEDENEQYYEDYADLNVHRVMLQDKPRMSFYRQCIQSAVGDPNTIVVDVGSGTGLLSCWAAKYGARHTFSVEASSLADLQPALFATNNVEDRVTVIHSTMEDVIAEGVEAFLAAHPVVREAGGVHVLVSEWMGFYLFHEGMLPSVLRARDFFVAVNRTLGDRVTLRMLPSDASLYVAPINLHPLREDRFAKDWELAEDLDLSIVAQLDYESTLQSAAPLVEVIPPRCLLHAGHPIFAHDLHTLSVHTVEQLTATVRFDFTESLSTRDTSLACVDGFVLWFDVGFDGCTLTTSPLAPPTHWKQTSVLLPEEVRVAEVLQIDELEDNALNVTFNLTTSEAHRRYYTISYDLLGNS